MFRRIVLALVCLSLGAAAADLKYSKKIKDASGEHGEMTLWFQGQRIRVDHRNEVGYGWKDGKPETIAYGPRVATIFQCDMRRVVELDWDHHQYTVTELDRGGMPADGSKVRFQPKSSGAKVKVQVDTRDTGETRQMFGQTARRFVTTQKLIPSAGACSSTAQETTEDGWYIDMEPPAENCTGTRRPMGRGFAVLASGDCVDEYEVLQSGPPTPPFPLEVTTTSHSNGAASRTMTVLVTEFSRLPLDPQDFDLPTGFKHVDQIDESPSLPWLLRGKLLWQGVKSTVWRWTPWGK